MATRKPRLSSEQTRERLIDAGIAALNASGMSIGLDSVNLEQAVRDAEVSRSSAYAVWSNEGVSPQEDFQKAVLLRAIDDRRFTLEALTQQVVELYGELAATMTPRQVFREVVRQTATRNVHATAESAAWKLVIALRAILHSTREEDRDRELVEWMAESQRNLRDYTIESVYKPMAFALGIKPRPQYGERAYELGELCASAVSEGFSMRYWLDTPADLDNLQHHAVEGGEANWSMYALIFEQIVEMFFIPNSGSWDELV